MPVKPHLLAGDAARSRSADGQRPRQARAELIVSSSAGPIQARSARLFGPSDLVRYEVRPGRAAGSSASFALTRSTVTEPSVSSATAFVSLNTINTHIRRIYAKLGATDRSSAVQRGRELRLLSSGCA
jgi:hypothetical protein